MRSPWLALLVGLLIGAGIAWWQSRDTPEQLRDRHQRAERAAAARAHDAEPVLYRWRDAGGSLQVTEQPPKGRPYQRIPREAKAGISVRGD
ncbi:MAG TPA: hypothetical protein VFF96_02135 [Pseudoxanthomonas sp.]|nr:hypothetical protein [Pseudoxanthomonas sp.]